MHWTIGCKFCELMCKLKTMIVIFFQIISDIAFYLNFTTSVCTYFDNNDQTRSVVVSVKQRASVCSRQRELFPR